MEAKTLIRTGVVVALIGIAGVLLEKIVWQTADTYPAFLAGLELSTLFKAWTVFLRVMPGQYAGLMIPMTFMTMQILAFKKNGTLLRCMNHPVSRVYKVIYPTPGKS